MSADLVETMMFTIVRPMPLSYEVLCNTGLFRNKGEAQDN